LANTHFVLGNTEEAARYFEDAIVLQPENIEWRFYK